MLLSPEPSPSPRKGQNPTEDSALERGPTLRFKLSTDGKVLGMAFIPLQGAVQKWVASCESFRRPCFQNIRTRERVAWTTSTREAHGGPPPQAGTRRAQRGHVRPSEADRRVSQHQGSTWSAWPPPLPSKTGRRLELGAEII